MSDVWLDLLKPIATPERLARVRELRAGGATWRKIADVMADEWPGAPPFPRSHTEVGYAFCLLAESPNDNP